MSLKEKILKNRIEFSTLYDCFSLKDGDAEAYFSRKGCEICCDGAGDVYDVVHLAKKDIKNKNFNDVYESQLCGACLCSMVNGDDSDLDFLED
jgi:hypothetical protein